VNIYFLCALQPCPQTEEKDRQFPRIRGFFKYLTESQEIFTGILPNVFETPINIFLFNQIQSAMKQHYTFAKLLLVIIFAMPGLLHAQAIRDSIRKNYTKEKYEAFLLKEKRGEIPDASGPVQSMRSGGDLLINNNSGITEDGLFTQSETAIIVSGDNVIIGFNDSGSRDGDANKFTGWSYSSDGGASFTDGGTLPTNDIGDLGDPVLALNESTGRIYFATLGFSGDETIQVFTSDDNGVSWNEPVVGTPGGSNEDKQWMVVDNFAGTGNGNVYLISRRFGTNRGIYLFTSTDNGATFGPDGGVEIVSASAGNQQGAFVAVAPDHSVYAFWMDDVNNELNMRKSTDFGATFGSAVTFVTDMKGGQTNNGLYLTGKRKSEPFFDGFRSNSFPHAAVNPVNGDIYVVYNDDPDGASQGTDRANVYMVMSSDGGATWTTPELINDDGTTTDQWQPTIAVTPDGTHLGIFFYSRENSDFNNNFSYNGRIGKITGSTVTFTPTFQISEIYSLPEFGRDNQVNIKYMGDYNSAYATNTLFHVVWSDNRDDHPDNTSVKDPNVYYRSIPVSNTPPVALCQSVSVAADENCQAFVTAEQIDNGSYDPDGDPITLTLSSAGPFGLGETQVTLTVEDSNGESSTCDANVTVYDGTAPVAPQAPDNVNVQCAQDVPTPVDLTAIDNCDGDITVSPTSVITSGSSPHDFTEVRTWTFTDAAGNSSSVEQTIVVYDDTPPVLAAITNPIILRPPNHKYHTITLEDVFVSVTDNCSELTIDDVFITMVSSDEEENATGEGDGNTWDDIVIAPDCNGVDLRAERYGGGNGRVYTLTLSVSDEKGNNTTTFCEVHVPHDDEDLLAVIDGAMYDEECLKSRIVSFTGEDILLKNYPNPFNGTTTISFRINESDHTTLKVYDIYGKLITTLFDDMAHNGRVYTFTFEGDHYAKGIYMYHLESGNHLSEIRKMILMK
jgi:hypothetical protein